MFRIRRIYDDVLPSSQSAIAGVQEILRAQFSELTEAEIAKLPEQLRNPLKYRFRSVLFVGESGGRVKGFALVLHEPQLGFCYLDYLATCRRSMGGGIGGALYERVRAEARFFETLGLFFECLPDERRLCPDEKTRRQNAARLRFYERYGARPIAGTAYETPCQPGDQCPPYLVYDDLGRENPLRHAEAQAVVRAILERKYAHLCSQDYIEAVVSSFQDDPVRLRDAHYVIAPTPETLPTLPPADRRISLIVTDQHAIHHVRERGYVESPVRLRTIRRDLGKLDIFFEVPPRHYSERYITAVHDTGFVRYLKRMCTSLSEGESVYPYVFPIRNAARPPKELAIRAGYYCVDTFTPLNRNVYLAARRAVDCALTGAARLLQGDRLAYALVRPPGHHAERRAFGGFCYFNSAAVAAQYLSAFGRIAILDIDYHHGNGQQDIFYERPDVLTVSIHGHPRWTYPFFSGFEDERGAGPGVGYNLNLPLPEGIDGGRYREELERSLRHVERFRPMFLVVPLGLDTASRDPTGSWLLRSGDFETNGKMIGALHLPTLVVQEGGYDNRVLGINARHFFLGLWQGAYGSTQRRPRVGCEPGRPPQPPTGVRRSPKYQGQASVESIEGM